MKLAVVEISSGFMNVQNTVVDREEYFQNSALKSRSGSGNDRKWIVEFEDDDFKNFTIYDLYIWNEIAFESCCHIGTLIWADGSKNGKRSHIVGRIVQEAK